MLSVYAFMITLAIADIAAAIYLFKLVGPSYKDVPTIKFYSGLIVAIILTVWLGFAVIKPSQFMGFL